MYLHGYTQIRDRGGTMCHPSVLIGLKFQALHKRFDYIWHKKLHDMNWFFFCEILVSALEGLEVKVLAINVSKLTTSLYLALED